MRAARMLPAMVLAGWLFMVMTSPASAAAGLKLVEIKGADGGRFGSPTGIGPSYVASPPGDTRRTFVVTQDGYVYVIVDGVVRPEPFLDLHTRTDVHNENGMFTIAFDPDYTDNGIFYVNFSDLSGGPNSELDRHTIRAFRRSTANPDVADVSTEREILTVPSSGSVPGCETMDSPHYGGQMAVGPDGNLWISIGDGGDGDDCDSRLLAKDLDDLHGKLLRITPDPVDGGYTVPADNPLVGRADARPEVFAYGLRNPWRFAFDPQAPHDIVIGDVGEGWFEELDRISSDPADAPRFLGWPCWEANMPFVGSCTAEHAPTAPMLAHEHAGGCSSIISGPFLRDPALGGDYPGRLVYGFFCDGPWPAGGQIHTIDVHGDVTPRYEGLSLGAGLSSFGLDGCGRAYVMSVREQPGGGKIGLWRIDGDRPSGCGKTTAITGGPSGTTDATTAAFTYMSTLASATFTCTLDGDDVPCDEELTGLADGEHTFTVTAASAAQGIVATPALRTWRVDTAAPAPPPTEPTPPTPPTEPPAAALAAHDPPPPSAVDPVPGDAANPAVPWVRPAPARLTGPRRLRADRRGRVALRLAPHSGGGRATITVRDGRRRAAGTRRVTLHPGRPLRLRVRLTRTFRRQLQRRGALHLTVRVTLDTARTAMYRITVRAPARRGNRA